MDESQNNHDELKKEKKKKGHAVHLYEFPKIQIIYSDRKCLGMKSSKGERSRR